MLGLVPVAAALAVLAGNFDVNANVVAEARAGEAPLIVDQPPEPSLVGIVTPGAEIQYLDPRLDLRLGYSLRIFWRTSPEDPSPAPLYLNTATLALTARPTRRLQIKLAATAFEGSADYTFLPVIFGQSQAALAVVPRIFSAALEGTARLRADRLVTPEIAVQAIHSQPIGVSEQQAPAQDGAAGAAVTYTLPHFTSLSGTPGVEMRVSRINDLTLESVFQYEYVSDINSAVTTGGGLPSTHSISAVIVIPTVASRTFLARNADLILRLG